MGKYVQYIVTITSPATLFVKMTQSEKVSSCQGKHALFMILALNEGKRVNSFQNINIASSTLPPTNMLSISTEALIDTSYILPVQFTLIVGANHMSGEAVATTFNIKFYCTDKRMRVNTLE